MRVFWRARLSSGAILVVGRVIEISFRTFQEESNLESLTELGFSEEEVDILVSKALKSMDDIAELAVDELQDIIEISDKKAADIIMKARESWFN